MSKLFLPIGVTIVHNVNHSNLSGIIKREGVIHPTEIVNLVPLYKKKESEMEERLDIEN